MKRIVLAIVMVFSLSTMAIAGKIDILRTEITTDPLVRGYSGMTDLQVADDMNLLNRPDTASIEAVIKFMLMDNTYKTDGDDTQDRSIWQRMKEVVAMANTPSVSTANPWGSTSIGSITEIRQVKTHQLVEFFTLSAQGNLSVDLTDSNFQVYLAGAEAAGCLSAAQETSLLALSDNLKSRGQELGIGTIRENNVTEARP